MDKNNKMIFKKRIALKWRTAQKLNQSGATTATSRILADEDVKCCMVKKVVYKSFRPATSKCKKDSKEGDGGTLDPGPCKWR